MTARYMCVILGTGFVSVSFAYVLTALDLARQIAARKRAENTLIEVEKRLKSNLPSNEARISNAWVCIWRWKKGWE